MGEGGTPKCNFSRRERADLDPLSSFCFRFRAFRNGVPTHKLKNKTMTEGGLPCVHSRSFAGTGGAWQTIDDHRV
jgi:hypothetical protein